MRSRRLVGTTYREETSSRGEANDKLSRLESARGKMSKVTTHSALAVIKDHERGNKVRQEVYELHTRQL